MDIRSKQDFLNLPPVNTLFYEVKSIASSFFSVNLTWIYPSDKQTDIIGFKVYKANTQRSLLNKVFNINQKTLEKTSANRNLFSNTNLLYNKSLFSQNSSVKIQNSNSDKYNKKEGELSEYFFQSITFVNVNSNKSSNIYRFTDKNIKFGESYIYYVTAVTKTIKETSPSLVFVPVEFISHPSKPDYLKISETSQGLLLNFGTKDKNILDFIVFRKDGDKKFELLTKISPNTNNVYFTDTEIFPKKLYTYRVYSRDIWGNVSLESVENSKMFNYIPFGTSLELRPDVSIISTDNSFKFKITNKSNHVTSVRIERMDVWRFEKQFEVKSKDGFSWPTNMLFVDGVIDHEDDTIQRDKVYSYKITCFNKQGLPVCYIFSSYLKMGDSFFNELNNKNSYILPKIESFTADIVNRNQTPVHIKLTWNISGEWSYLIVDNGKSRIKIDSIHKLAFLNNFEIGKKYSLKVELYDLNEKKVEEKTVAEISL